MYKLDLTYGEVELIRELILNDVEIQQSFATVEVESRIIKKIKKAGL